MNYLSINCSVENGFGRIIIVILDEEDCIYKSVFKSPSVFSFKKNSAEILNWHRDNIISIISQFKINAVIVKKTERTSFFSKPKNSDIFKLYLEGTILSLAGSIGIFNKHYYKTDIKAILKAPKIFDLNIKEICNQFNLKNNFEHVSTGEIEATKETLLAAIALKTNISND